MPDVVGVDGRVVVASVDADVGVPEVVVSSPPGDVVVEVELVVSVVAEGEVA
ncbi:MAG: hypothetical protein NTW76_09675 [Corynebacteriales bacterium]|nr:hypothetical protein [Mycobacteriales bacterium]